MCGKCDGQQIINNNNTEKKSRKSQREKKQKGKYKRGTANTKQKRKWNGKTGRVAKQVAEKGATNEQL